MIEAVDVLLDVIRSEYNELSSKKPSLTIRLLSKYEIAFMQIRVFLLQTDREATQAYILNDVWVLKSFYKCFREATKERKNDARIAYDDAMMKIRDWITLK